MKMLLEKPYNVNKKEEKREVLNYISLLKYWSMILIIRMHIYEWKQRKIDYGARMCEFLFVSSGFLVGYNYYKRTMQPTYYISCKYTYKHLRSFYPLHIINSLYCIYRYKKKI
jgi:peptidoglycan/LPS O-acetylase OafA/YrhL